MFDNHIPSSTAKEAEYYKTVLEKERASREQADKEIIDLLHDVKNRYDSKLSTYMAKKSGGNKKPNQKGDNKNVSKNPTQKGNANCQDKSTNNTTNDQVTKADEGWGDSGDQTQVNSWNEDENQTDAQNESGSHGQDETWENNDDQAQDNSWDNNASTTQNHWGNDAAQTKDNGWGESGGHDQDDWGDSGSKSQDKNKTDNKGKAQKNNKAATKNKTPDKGKTASASTDQDKGKTDSGNKTKDKGKAADKASNEDNGWGEDNSKIIQKTDCVNKTQDNDWGLNASQTQDKIQPRESLPTATPSKDFLDMKSQLWTAKLDLRLLERDKSKLSDEVTNLQAERDDLIKKLAQANQDQDSTRVRIRGLTVDLLAANEDIHKLNQRIDELENEKRHRERDVNMTESKRRSLECKYKNYQQQIVELESELKLIKEEKDEYEKRSIELTKRNERLENDLSHSRNLIRTLKDGCAAIEDQAKTFEIRHDTVIMSKADLERELIAIKEESSRHITTINKLQKSNEQISKAFIQSVEAHETCKKEVENLHREYSKKLEVYEVENLRLVEANKQLRKVIDHLQKKR